jgi:hypothetical protein
LTKQALYSIKRPDSGLSTALDIHPISNIRGCPSPICAIFSVNPRYYLSFTFGHLEKPPKLAIKSQLIWPIHPCQPETGHFSPAGSGFFQPEWRFIRPSDALCLLTGKSRDHAAGFQGAQPA